MSDVRHRGKHTVRASSTGRVLPLVSGFKRFILSDHRGLRTGEDHAAGRGLQRTGYHHR